MCMLVSPSPGRLWLKHELLRDFGIIKTYQPCAFLGLRDNKKHITPGLSVVRFVLNRNIDSNPCAFFMATTFIYAFFMRHLCARKPCVN